MTDLKHRDIINIQSHIPRQIVNDISYIGFEKLNKCNKILEQEEIIQIEDININNQMEFIRCFYK